MIHLGLLIEKSWSNIVISFRALTNDDELREISSLLSALIRKVDFGKDVEQELKFCVEARGLFGYIDSVTITLIQVNNRQRSFEFNFNHFIYPIES